MEVFIAEYWNLVSRYRISIPYFGLLEKGAWHSHANGIFLLHISGRCGRVVKGAHYHSVVPGFDHWSEQYPKTFFLIAVAGKGKPPSVFMPWKKMSHWNHLLLAFVWAPNINFWFYNSGSVFGRILELGIEIYKFYPLLTKKNVSY